ncbi:MAG: aminoglycoside adenylyltransferase domain-containing protein [Syntrophothermus sp.]
MNQCIPESIQPLLEDYLQQLGQHLPDLIFSFYIVGSISLGEYNDHFSDIDFITVLHRGLHSSEIRKLQGLHQTLKRKYPAQELSGSYFQTCDLGRLDGFLEPHPRYHDGRFDPHGPGKVNLVTWWELKHYGIPVVGDGPQSLPFTVDWELLLKSMKVNLNTYWRSWTTRPKRILILYSDWGIQWAVTGVLRQFYSFRENTLTTKIKAARYALDHVPERWHPIIQEAINIRENRDRSLYRFRTTRMLEAVRFLKYMIQTCNSSYSIRIHTP